MEIIFADKELFMLGIHQVYRGCHCQAQLRLQLQLQFEADLAFFSFYPPPTHPSGQVVTQLIEYWTSTPTSV